MSRVNDASIYTLLPARVHRAVLPATWHLTPELSIALRRLYAIGTPVVPWLVCQLVHPINLEDESCARLSCENLLEHFHVVVDGLTVDCDDVRSRRDSCFTCWPL